MRRLNARTLSPGMRLPHGLYTHQGVKLLSAGTLLTPEMCRVITASNWGGLYFASSAADLRRTHPRYPLHQPASQDASAGAGPDPVDDVFDALLPLDAEQVESRLRAARMRIADQYVADLEQEWRRLPQRIEPSASPGSDADDPRAVRVHWPEENRLAEFRAERISRLQRLLSRLVPGLPVLVGEVGALVAELMHLRRLRPERFAQLALHNLGESDDLAEHCYAVACLSVAVASRLNWSTKDVRLAGLAGLLADVGMAFVPEDLRRHSKALTEVEVNRVRRHPAYSVAMLEAVEGLPPEVRLAAHQHHERENGSGYPRGLRSRAICDLAKVVAVADVFAASAARRRYRSHKKPHDAMEEMIMLASAGVFHKSAVRALVESVGLFPVGSWVLLSNGRAAVVVGATPDAVDRPIVRMLERSILAPSAGLTVRLADFPRDELRVIRAVDPPDDPALARAS